MTCIISCYSDLRCAGFHSSFAGIGFIHFYKLSDSHCSSGLMLKPFAQRRGDCNLSTGCTIHPAAGIDTQNWKTTFSVSVHSVPLHSLILSSSPISSIPQPRKWLTELRGHVIRADQLCLEQVKNKSLLHNKVTCRVATVFSSWAHTHQSLGHLCTSTVIFVQMVSLLTLTA